MSDLPVLGEFQPLPAAPTAPRIDADRILAEARAEAARITHAAETRARQLTASAEAAAQAGRARAKSDAKKARQEAHIDTWSARAVITAAVGLTASGEYRLARMVGFGPEVAWLLPVVVDVYVIQAFRRHRDIAPAIGLTIATNVIYHLADAGLFGVKPNGQPQWWLIAIVASIASLILWRMHLMLAPAKPRQKPAKTTREAPPESQVAPDLAGAAEAAKTAPEQTAKTPPVPAARTPRSDATPRSSRQSQRAARKAAKTRRSMDEWVEVATPVFHAEFTRLRRQPTANEFAKAIATAGLGTVGTSTAKNIRTEILDRADVPALTD